MAHAYKNTGKHTRATPQTQKAHKDQVQNSAGGFSFALDDFGRLDRFLILGADSPTYYASQQKLALENAKCVERALDQDPYRVIDTIVDVSENGRAYRNEAALFALAMASAHNDGKVRAYALSVLPRVARIGTHLFTYAEYVKEFRGWGRALRRGVANWYTKNDAKSVAFQAVKYRQRDGWTHRDLLRLTHPTTDSLAHSNVFNWICGRPTDPEMLPDIIGAYEAAKNAKASELVKLIKAHNLPREAIPTEMLKNKTVWEALLVKMPLTALIRNLGAMSAMGLFTPMGKNEQLVVSKLTDEDYLQKSRVHPFAVLLALKTYASGHGFRGSNSWTVNQNIVAALDEAFLKTFKNVTPTGKRHLLAVDVSGSMGCYNLMNSNVTAAEAAAAMALITAKTEPLTHVTAFSHRMVDVDMSRVSTLDGTIRKFGGISMGGTDCSLPMQYALKNNIEVDAFVVYTDNETYCGRMHPHEALNQYRRKMGIDAKLIVCGFVSNNFSIADPNDAGMLDIVGFDSNAPSIMTEFVR